MQNYKYQIFLAYSRKDSNILDELRTHFVLLEKSKKIKIWYDGKIQLGTNWDSEIQKNLYKSDIILILVSANAIASTYFYEQEVQNALKRHKRGTVKVIPVILKPCVWKYTPLGKLQALPKDGKPITAWSNRDDAYFNIVQQIGYIIEEIRQARSIAEKHINDKIAERKRIRKKKVQIDSNKQTNQKSLRLNRKYLMKFLKYLVEITAFYIGDYNYFKNIGKVLSKEGNIEEAIVQYKKAIKINPKDVYTYSNLGDALLEKKNIEGAIEQYKKAIKIDPNIAYIHSDLGYALFKKGNIEGAIKQAQKAIKINTKSIYAYYIFGEILFKKGNIEGAIEQHKKAIEIDPMNSSIYHSLGYILFKKGNIERAIEQYKRAIKFNSRSAGIYSDLGYALFKKGNIEGAIEQYKKAIEIDPIDALNYNYLGIVYLFKGLFSKSKKLLQKSYQLDVNGYTLMSLGHIHLIENNIKKALNYYYDSQRVFNNDIFFIHYMKNNYEECNLSQYNIEESYYFKIIKKLEEKN